MPVPKEQKVALKVQFFLVALLTAVVFGLYLLCGGELGRPCIE